MGFLTSILFGDGSGKPADILGLVKEGALVIDVRSPDEFAEGHIEGSINIPHDIVTREIDHHETDYSRVIIVYCLGGGRSSIAKKALENSGYRYVVNGGGYEDMVTALAGEE